MINFEQSAIVCLVSEMTHHYDAKEATHFLFLKTDEAWPFFYSIDSKKNKSMQLELVEVYSTVINSLFITLLHCIPYYSVRFFANTTIEYLYETSLECGLLNFV